MSDFLDKRNNVMDFDVRQFSSDKILKHLDKVNSWLRGGNPAPITVELDLTNTCNHRCPECVRGDFQHKTKDALSKELAKDIVTQLAGEGVRGLIFTGGGEPLCHKDAIDIVEFAHHLGIDIGFITNGSLLDKDKARALLMCCRWLRISLDAASGEVFKKMHGLRTESFNAVINNIKLTVNLKKKLKSKTTIGVGYLTGDYTKDGMVSAAKLCRSLGVDYLQFRPIQLYRNNKFIHHWTDVEEEIKQCVGLSKANYKVLFSKHKYEMTQDKNYGRSYGKCYGQQFAAVICADAKMYICCHLRGNEKYCVGDLNKQSFREIWDSKKREEIVKSIDFRDCVPLCRDNTFNQILWNIKQPKVHVNFL